MQLNPCVFVTHAVVEPLCRQSRHCARGKQCRGNLVEDLVSESRMLHPRGQQILTSEHSTCGDDESFGRAFCQGNHQFRRYTSFLLDRVSFVCGAHVKTVKGTPFQQGRHLLYYRLYKYVFPLFEIKYLVFPRFSTKAACHRLTTLCKMLPLFMRAQDPTPCLAQLVFRSCPAPLQFNSHFHALFLNLQFRMIVIPKSRRNFYSKICQDK
jgi:hypothetical protein